MARTVDPARHEARRLHIIDAALTCFATAGFERTTTAAICRQAGIGSGTFFHYFPTKTSLLVAVIELGTQETREFLTRQEGATDPVGVIHAIVAQSMADADDDRAAGFVRAVAAIMTEPQVSAVLQADERVLREGLTTWAQRAHAADVIRTDLSAARIASWLMLLIDGFFSRVVDETTFRTLDETVVMHDLIDRFLHQ